MDLQNYKFNDLSRFVHDLRYLLRSGGALTGSGALSDGMLASLMKFIVTIKDLLIAVFMICVMIAILYLMYRMFFKSYPKVLVNFFTFSFFKKQNIDTILRENGVFLNQLKFMLSNFACLPPYDAYAQIYNVSTNLKDVMKDYNNVVNTQFKSFKYDEKYYESFKVFYMYHDRVYGLLNQKTLKFNPKGIIDKVIADKYDVIEYDNKDVLVDKDTYDVLLPFLNAYKKRYVRSMRDKVYTMEYRNGKLRYQDSNKRLSEPFRRYFETCLNFDLKDGLIDRKNQDRPGNKSHDQLLTEYIYKQEKEGYTKLIQHIKLYNLFKQIGLTFNEVANQINQKPIHAFMLLPLNDKQIQLVAKEYSANSELIKSGAVYEKHSSELNEFTWYMIEATSNRSFGSINPDVLNDVDKSKAVYYVNLSYEKKSEAEQRLFGKVYESKGMYIPETIGYSVSKLEKLKNDTGIELSVTKKKFKATANKDKGLKKEVEDLIEKISNIDKEITEAKKNTTGSFEFIKKNPLYCHVYYSNIEKKGELYDLVMRAYNVLGEATCNTSKGISGTLQNIKTNGENYKRFVVSVNYLNLFVNSYVKEMTQLYEKQNLSEAQFFEELWTPYFDDILHYRIKPYYDRIFNKKYMENVIKPKFIIPWKAFGNLIRKTIKKSFKMMFTHQKSHDTKMPDGPSTLT